MDPKIVHAGWVEDTSPEDELMLDEHLNELEVEDLLGHDIDFDEHEDWRAIDF